MSEAKVYYKQRRQNNVPKYMGGVYNKCLKAQKRKRTKQKLRRPQKKSTKSTAEEGPKNKNNLDQSQRLQRKVCFSPWMDHSSF